jgi:NADPH:quinone reductase-like Zn-dependent oxidoreductase
MNAIGFNRFGEPDVMERMQLPDPLPSSKEAVVRLSCTSVNTLDTLMRKGYFPNLSMPHVPGSDIVGKIESIGKDVEGFNSGEFVIANALFGCGLCKECLAGNESLCIQWKVFGRDSWGSYGELVKLPADRLIKPPKQFSDEELACMPLSLATAWRSLDTLAKAKNGDVVVIRGASGNVGLWATLLAKSMGLKVIALTRNESKAKNLSKIGADLVLNPSDGGKDIVKEIKDFTNDLGANFVLESFGSTLGQSIDMLKDDGKVVLFGTIGGSNATIDVKRTYLKSRQIVGTHAASKMEFEKALNFVASNNIKPIIGKTLPITEASEAQRLLENSEVFGKIVLKSSW